MVVRPGTAPPSSLGSKTDDEDDIDNQRSTKRIRTSLTQSPERQRGQLTKRGKTKKGRPYHVGRRRAATEVRSDEGEDEEVDSSDGELPEDYQDLAKTKVSQLSEANKLAKNKLASLEVATFRKLCGVKKDEPWPLIEESRIDKASGEPFYTPDFNKDVSDPTNADLFEKVGRLVMGDLKDKKNRLAVLMAKGVWFNKSTIVELAKTSFRGFKTTALAQRDAGKRRQFGQNQRNTKLRDRRKLQFEHLLTAVDSYIQLGGQDPTDLLCEEMMSDYASGPEDAAESHEAWKLRMAKESKMDGAGMAAHAFDKLVFWERIHPEWRSDELSAVFRELERIWWVSLTTSKRKRYSTIKVNSTSRSSSVPPSKAPYDFGICADWYDKHKNTYADSICDWYTYGDINGFGSKASDGDVVPVPDGGD